MRCPFGYTADDADNENLDGEADEGEEEGVEEINCTTDANVHATEAEDIKPQPKEKAKQKKEPTVDAFGFDKDPVSWFYENQIRSEADFQQKKSELQQEAKRRLDGIMAARKKLLEFDSDIDGMSNISSELSDLDSDVHSLSSLKNCAETWIEKTNYKAVAEEWVKFAVPPALAVTVFCMYQSYSVIKLFTKLPGIILNTQWAAWCLTMTGLMVVCLGLFYFAATNRSKRMLLSSQIGLLLVYASSMLLVAYMHAKPTTLDVKLQEAACHRMEKIEMTSRLCKMMPTIGKEVAEAMPPLLTSCASVGATAVILAALGIWYVFELSYIEKKAIKHNRRNKRQKHTIPWNKIRIGGAAVTSGQAASTATTDKGTAKAPAGGKCPVAH